MGLTGFLHLLWLVPAFALGFYLLVFVMMLVSVQVRNRRYLAGGIDLVDEVTQKQFGDYITSYLEHSGYSVSLVRQDEEIGTALLATKNGRERFIFAKRSRGGVPDEEVANALALARTATAGEVQIITNSLLSRSKDEQVKKQGVTVWDREKLIPYMGKAGARKFALQALATG